MPRPLFDSPYIFGLHDPGGEHLMVQANRRGWIVFTIEIGNNPNDFGGYDFAPWANQNFGIICRINNGYGSAGTIPYSGLYTDFARRAANFVAASPGCKLWIIGNEMNHSQEWPAIPGVASAAMQSLPAAAARPQPPRGPTSDPRGRSNPSRFSAITAQREGPSAAAMVASSAMEGFEPITPDLYSRCFRLCRDAIKLLPGHGDDQVIVGAVAPWNDQVKYPANPTGDWVRYFADMLALIGGGGLDGIALHTYSHGSDPQLITDTSLMDPPFQNRYYNFPAYRNFMDAIPASQRSLPVYITEADQNDPWVDQNNGWVQAAYAEINHWNQVAGAQQIRCLALYRWPPYDQWYIQGKQGVIDGFVEAMRNEYKWQTSLPKPADFQAGDKLRTLDIVNFRQSPGGPTLAQIPVSSEVIVLNRQYAQQSGLVWWNVQRALATGVQAGWLAQFTADGLILLEKVNPSINPGTFKIGDQVQTQTIVRMRQTPGITGKPANDIVADTPQGTVLTVVDGPMSADGMTWWRNQGKLADNRQVIGWQAEKLMDGTTLLALYSTLPMPPSTPEPPSTFQTGDRFRTTTIVRLRRTPGTSNKPANDVLADIVMGTEGSVLAGPSSSDGMTWWQVSVANSSGQTLQGWMAEALAGGDRLMERIDVPSATFTKGDLGVTTDFANARRTPGVNGKPADDILGMFAPRATVNIIDGPTAQDDLIWWRVGGISNSGVEMIGYVAEITPSGQALLTTAPKLPGTNIPDKQTGQFLAAPFDGRYGISQLWGENPAYYSRYSYDGVALKGHNGIDFLTPSGTLLYAADGGEVAQAGFEADGFGNYILLRHAWGESIYAHMDNIAVAVGQVIGRGQYIGVSGNTGGSLGPHLHFSIRINPYQRTDGWGGFSDPLPYLPPGSFALPVYVQDPSSLQIAAALPAPAGQANRNNPPSMGEVPSDQRP